MPKSVQIRDLDDEVYAALVRRAAEAGVSLRVYATSAHLQADSDRLLQVLTNLLANAIKFSPAGETIRVGLQDTLEEVVLSVSDRGTGIPEGQLEAIFGLFYQAEDPVSRRSGGMGLGLYISKEIVTRHGGRIWAESQPNAGSTFKIALPRRNTPLPPPASRWRAGTH